jgi:small conductance mechanosensitive channel
MRKRMIKRNVEKTIVQVVYYLSNKIVKLLLLLMAIGFLGIDTTSVAGLITAAGLGVSLAVQGTLSNFAGGILILFLRPFKVDDYIECQGTSGTVEDIRIFYTHLRTPDNKVVLIPNGSLIGGNVINYSTKATRRVDLVFAIDYEADYKQAKAIILDVCAKHQLILEDPAPAVRIAEWASSSINLSCKVWVKNANYWAVTFDLLETVYDEMNKAGIKIPYNQLEISYRDALKQQEKENK